MARDSRRADELNRRAAELLESDPMRSEGLLREALTADLFHGPAHNNLGVLHLSRGELYLAAEEFEWARRLMPGHPDPRVNLALTLERGGRADDAIAAYRSALEVFPDHLQAVQGLTRIEVLTGRTTAETRRRLEDLALRGETAEWRRWARLKAAGVEGRSGVHGP